MAGGQSSLTFSRGPTFELRSAAPSRGQIVLSVLLEFWLTDGSEPLAAAEGKLTPAAGGSGSPGPGGDIMDGYGSLFGLTTSGPSLR
jgi:hypothetical protein